jgi:hypothetical protein
MVGTMLHAARRDYNVWHPIRRANSMLTSFSTVRSDDTLERPQYTGSQVWGATNLGQACPINFVKLLLTVQDGGCAGVPTTT